MEKDLRRTLSWDAEEECAPIAAELPPSLAGRYVVIDEIGQGGMGIVYAAYDRELDRKVALKLLRPERAPSAEAAARLVSEAQALARLQHPNVVTVHDIGTIDGRIAIAMELIDGASLRSWLTACARGWREVVRVFVAAGRGLDAAHRAGLVHRDFKPDNVLVDAAGRVRVVDFGLARRTEVADGTRAPSPGMEAAPAGTPRYMAPEHRAGGDADPRSDQFSFAVALSEALSGVRSARWVPRRLRAAIAVALRDDPAARHPSMAAFIAAIERDPSARLRRVALFAAPLVAAAAALYFWASRPQPCRDVGGELAGTWDASIKTAVGLAFRATGHPYAERAFAETARALDSYAAAIAKGTLDACEACQVRHEQSPALWDLRARCLHKRRQELRALALELERVDRDNLLHAPDAARGLSDLSGCGDLETLSSPTPVPRDPALRARIDALGPILATAKALTGLHRFRPALPLLVSGVALARATGYQPLIAELALNLGLARRDAGELSAAEEMFLTAAGAALAGRAEPIAVEAMVRLATLTARADRFEEAAHWGDLAWAIVQRLGAESGALAGSVSRGRAYVASRLSHFDESKRLSLDALQRFEREYGPTDLRLVRPLLDLATVAGDTDGFDEARGYTQRAIAILDGGGPTDGSYRAEAECELGYLAYAQGRYPEAVQFSERALAMAEQIYGVDALELSTFMMPLAYIDERLGRDDEAVALFRRVLAVTSRGLSADNSSVLEARVGVAAILGKRGELEAAAVELGAILDALEKKDASSVAGDVLAQTLADLAGIRVRELRLDDAERIGRRALAAAETALGESQGSASVLVLLGDVALRRGQVTLARTLTARALAILEKTGNPQSLADGLVVAGRVELAAGHTAEARATLERARGLYAALPKSEVTLARVDVPLAQALRQSGEKDPARALALEARASLRAHHPVEERDLVELLRDAEALLPEK